MGEIDTGKRGAFRRLLDYLAGTPGHFAADCRQYIRDIGAGWKTHWKAYLLQSLVAMVVILIIFFVVTPERPVIVASIGSSVFIVFALPNNRTAQPRNLIGGHIIGLFCGSLAYLFPETSMLPSLALYSAAVGLSILLMVALKMEHPPASGTALGIALNGFGFNVAIAVVLSSIVLAVAHFLLCRRFCDLDC
jgi:CBS domain-containing membrane protein